MNEKTSNPSDSLPDSGSSLSWSETDITRTASDILSSNPTRRRRRERHTPEEIAKELRVDEDGNLWWRRQKTGRSRPRIMDKPVGVSDGRYLFLELDTKKYKCHTLAWCLYYGCWPVGQLDHINGLKTDNRKVNLREVNNGENQHNQHELRRNNTTGYTGVQYEADRNLYRTTLKINGTTYSSRHRTLEEAVEARRQLEVEHGVHEFSLLGKGASEIDINIPEGVTL